MPAISWSAPVSAVRRKRSHGSPHAYDTHVPLMLYGAGVRPGVHTEPVRPQALVQEPVPAWGLMLQGGAEEYASTAPWIAIFPGVAIVLSVLGINLFGDALRDTLDPKLRKR